MKMSESRNKELFHAIATAMREEPKHYNQGEWGLNAIGGLTSHSCGTAHCIGGFAVALSGYKPTRKDWTRVTDSLWPWFRAGESTPETAQALLGLSNQEAGDLFSASWRPKDAAASAVRGEALVSLVADAMDLLAEGASIQSVTAPYPDYIRGATSYSHV